MAEERRYKVMSITGAILMYMRFGACQRDGDTVRYPVLRNWPEGVRIVAVNYDPYSDIFLFRLYHPDWPEIVEGEPIPILALQAGMESLKVVLPEGEQPKTADPGPRRGREFI